MAYNLGIWVVGGVEEKDQRSMFAVTVENKNAETLKDIIVRNVALGSIIYTEC